MSFFTSTQSDLLAILSVDGEPLTFTSRDGGSGVPFTSVLHRNGEDGSATVNIPVTVNSSPVFADNVTDGTGNQWYITETRETLQGRTYCDLKLSTYWKTVDFEQYTGGAWSIHTLNVNVLIQETNSYEDVDENGYFVETLETTVRSQSLNSPTQKMRIKNGSDYLYIIGKRQDDTGTRWTEWTCRTDEA